MSLAYGATLPVLALGLLCGGAALALVANELGKRARLPVPSRFVLAGGLGLGVVSIAIKVVIISTLSQADGQTLAHAGSTARATVQGWWPEAAEAAAPQVSAAPAGFRTWRALPEAAPEPRDNRATAAKIALGRMLFNDRTLSRDRSLACASCHMLGEGGDDNARYSTGYRGQLGNRNAPTVLNAAFLTRLFWDGRAPSLERQAEGPFVNPVEMAMPSLAAVEARVTESPQYRARFAEAFPGATPIKIRNITRAIAAYERSLITPDAPYDRYIRGEEAALSPAARRGMALFDETGCRGCHIDPVFSAAGSEKPLGVYRRFPVYSEDNLFVAKYGLLVDGAPARFRVPSLRNVALTAPYFHNGSVTELEEAIRVMAVSQLGRRLSNDPGDDLRVVAQRVADSTPGLNTASVRGRALSDGEVADIAAFLRALTAPVLPE